MKLKKLGCTGCPVCGSGHCNEAGLIEDCDSYVKERIDAQYPDLPTEKIQLNSSQQRRLEIATFRFKPSFTYDEVDALEHAGVIAYDDCEDLETARVISREKGGVIYTQVDSEISDDRVLSRGVRVVNRTGMYAVLRHLHVQKLTCPKCRKAETRREVHDEHVTVLFGCFFSATFGISATDQERQARLDKWEKEGRMEKWLRQPTL
jgi:hypothetical protein